MFPPGASSASRIWTDTSIGVVQPNQEARDSWRSEVARVVLGDEAVGSRTGLDHLGDVVGDGGEVVDLGALVAGAILGEVCPAMACTARRLPLESR